MKTKCLDINVSQNVDDQITRVKKDYASAIIIDGTMGKGKTHSAVAIADYIMEKNNMPPIDFKKQIGRGGEEFLTKLDISINEGLPVMIYDEAGDFSRRGALTKFNRSLNRIMEQYRQFHIIIIMVLPAFNSLDSSLLKNGVPRLLLHLTHRGKRYIKCSVYGLRRMFYLKANMDKYPDPFLSYKYNRPNCYGYIYPLSSERVRQLDKYSLTGKKNESKKARVTKGGVFNTKQITEELSKSKPWVNAKLRELNIKPDHKISGTRYFKNEVVDLLRDEIQRGGK